VISLPEETAQSEQPAPAAQQPTKPVQPAPPAKAGGDDNLMAALSYISIISVVMLFVKKDSDYVQFHAKQGTVLFVGEVVIWVLNMFTWFLFFIWGLLGLVFFIASIIGFIKAYSGERYRMPVVADIADKIKI
jgi:uncharacterized membrane protein